MLELRHASLRVLYMYIIIFIVIIIIIISPLDAKLRIAHQQPTLYMYLHSYWSFASLKACSQETGSLDPCRW